MELLFNESRQVYLSKINKVQDYIESHLEDELCIQLLAGIASFSEFHFQRIYRQITGESLYGFIKRLRLEKAVFLLRSSHKRTIQDIALSVGFSNQASFAKALKERYGVNASEFRKMQEQEMNKLVGEVSRNGKVSEDNMQYNNPMEVNIRTIDPVRIVYVRHTGAYKGDQDLFQTLFDRLYHYAEHQGLIHSGTQWFALYHDYSELTEEFKLRVSIGVSVGEELSRKEEISCTGEFGSTEIAGGKYAVGRFLLDNEEYQGAWNYMISKWLPESGYMPDDRLCFESYPSEEEGTDRRRIVEIFIPIIPL